MPAPARAKADRIVPQLQQILSELENSQASGSDSGSGQSQDRIVQQLQQILSELAKLAGVGLGLRLRPEPGQDRPAASADPERAPELAGVGLGLRLGQGQDQIVQQLQKILSELQNAQTSGSDSGSSRKARTRSSSSCSRILSEAAKRADVGLGLRLRPEPGPDRPAASEDPERGLENSQNAQGSGVRPPARAKDGIV